jgi:hypothetical protein
MTKGWFVERNYSNPVFSLPFFGIIYRILEPGFVKITFNGDEEYNGRDYGQLLGYRFGNGC